MSPPSCPIRRASIINAETTSSSFLFGQQSDDAPLDGGFYFSDHQQFFVEEITFLNTPPPWKLPLRERARITLLTGNGGVRLKMAALRKQALLLQLLTQVRQQSRGEESEGMPEKQVGPPSGGGDRLLQRQDVQRRTILHTPESTTPLQKADRRSLFRN